MNPMNRSNPEKNGNDLNSLIAKYNAELMNYYQRNASRILPTDDGSGTVSTPSAGVTVAERTEEPTMSKPENPADSPLPNEDEPEAIIAYPTRIVDAPEHDNEAAATRIEPETQATDELRAEPAPALDTAEAGNRQQLIEDAEEAVSEGIYEDFPEPEYVLPEEEQMGDIGYLQVTASAGRTALPIMNAFVTISRPEADGSTRLYWLALTDRDGNTPQLPLPTVSRNESLQPGISEPYISYNVQVDATGYYTVRNLNVPIYGGIYANQPVEMIPLPEQTPSGELTFP